MNTTISLKELTERYTTADIIRETSKKYTLFHEDAMSLLDLIQKIRNSSDNDSNGMDIAPMIAFWEKARTQLSSHTAAFIKITETIDLPRKIVAI